MILKKLDDFRKKIMPKLTENIGKSHRLKKRSEKVRVKTEGVDMPLDAQQQRYTNRSADRERRYIDRQVGSGGFSKDSVDSSSN